MKWTLRQRSEGRDLSVWALLEFISFISIEVRSQDQQCSCAWQSHFFNLLSLLMEWQWTSLNEGFDTVYLSALSSMNHQLPSCQLRTGRREVGRKPLDWNPGTSSWKAEMLTAWPSPTMTGDLQKTGLAHHFFRSPIHSLLSSSFVIITSKIYLFILGWLSLPRNRINILLNVHFHF